MKNELSRAMASADVKVRYDTQCKRVLSQKSLHGFWHVRSKNLQECQ